MTTEFQPVTIPGRPDIVGQRTINGIVEYQVHNNAMSEGGYVATNGKTLEHIELDVSPTKGSWHGDIAESMMAESPVCHHAQVPGYVAQGGKEKVFSLDAVDELVSEIVTARRQLTEAQAEIAALKAQVDRLQAPVSDEELEQLCSAKGIRAPTNAIIAARAAEEGK